VKLKVCLAIMVLLAGCVALRQSGSQDPEVRLRIENPAWATVHASAALDTGTVLLEGTVSSRTLYRRRLGSLIVLVSDSAGVVSKVGETSRV